MAVDAVNSLDFSTMSTSQPRGTDWADSCTTSAAGMWNSEMTSVEPFFPPAAVVSTAERKHKPLRDFFAALGPLSVPKSWPVYTAPLRTVTAAMRPCEATGAKWGWGSGASRPERKGAT